MRISLNRYQAGKHSGDVPATRSFHQALENWRNTSERDKEVAKAFYEAAEAANASDRDRFASTDDLWGLADNGMMLALARMTGLRGRDLSSLSEAIWETNEFSIEYFLNNLINDPPLYRRR